jgi:hypothetical protein
VVYTPSLRVQALQPPTSTKPVGPAQCNLHDPHPAPRVGVHSPPGLPASRCLSLTDREPLCGTKPMASLLRRARGGSDAAVGAQPAHGMSSLHPHPLRGSSSVTHPPAVVAQSDSARVPRPQSDAAQVEPPAQRSTTVGETSNHPHLHPAPSPRGHSVPRSTCVQNPFIMIHPHPREQAAECGGTRLRMGGVHCGRAHRGDEATDAERDEAYGAFECNICFDVATEPVVTLCGHMYCWPCLYRWLAPPLGRTHCPVCKGMVDATKVIPLYGRRDALPSSSSTTASKSTASLQSDVASAVPPHERGLEPVPCRPRSLRTDSAPPLVVRLSPPFQQPASVLFASRTSTCVLCDRSKNWDNPTSTPPHLKGDSLRNLGSAADWSGWTALAAVAGATAGATLQLIVTRLVPVVTSTGQYGGRWRWWGR